MKKTKKTKLLIAIILSIVLFVGAVITCLSFIKTSYAMKFNKPSRIIIYYNSEIDNIVFEPQDDEYKNIYSLMIDGYKQPMLNAIFNGELYKGVKVITHENLKVDFSGIKINFVYDTPQIVKYKTKEYINNGENYWYQNLIFDINNTNKFEYSNVAVITPENSVLAGYNYSLHYKAYSNFHNVYNYILNLF